jgi:hypothetical protein
LFHFETLPSGVLRRRDWPALFCANSSSPVFRRRAQTCVKHRSGPIGDKSFTPFLQSGSGRVCLINAPAGFEGDSAKCGSVGIKVLKRWLSQRNGCELRAQQAAIQKGAVMKKVTIVKSFITVVFLLAFLIVLPSARADQSDHATKVTFSQAVQLPGRVLPAGTYWFILPRDGSQHFIVRIFNSDRTALITTLYTINADRVVPTDHTAFTLAERGSEQPEAIVKWFYPGETSGHEFLYPKQLEKELAKDKQDTVDAGD